MVKCIITGEGPQCRHVQKHFVSAAYVFANWSVKHPAKGT